VALYDCNFLTFVWAAAGADERFIGKDEESAFVEPEDTPAAVIDT
jgi:hypothetical protein